MAYRVGTQKERNKMNTPTKITVSRIVLICVMLIGLFVLALIPNLSIPDIVIGEAHINVVYFVCCIIFLVAALTDFLDGYLARKNNQVTDLGKFLDPIADKLLIDGTMIFLLVPQAYAPSHTRDTLSLSLLAFCVIIMIARDLIVDVLRLIAVQKNVVIAANIFGKAKTVLQMIAIPALLLNDWPFVYFSSSIPQPLHISNILFYIATIMSLISGIIYVYQNRSVLKESK